MNEESEKAWERLRAAAKALVNNPDHPTPDQFEEYQRIARGLPTPDFAATAKEYQRREALGETIKDPRWLAAKQEAQQQP